MNKKTGLLLVPMLVQGCVLDFRDHSECAPESEVIRNETRLKESPTPINENGDFLIEGDILINNETHEEFDGLFRPKSGVIRNKTWTDGTVYYTISEEVSPGKVYRAMELWEELTDGLIQFIERTDEKNYIEVIKGNGCYSSVGMTGGRQFLSLGSGCLSQGTSAHEFGHALGLWHEQSRTDRDEYVKINWCNISGGKEHNFRRHDAERIEDVGPYDYDSLMHYVRSAFTTNIYATIQSKTNTQVKVLPRNGPSSGDVAGVIALYSLE